MPDTDEFSPELISILEEALEMTSKEKTVLFLFDDMVSINEHFQAILDWFKSSGNPMRRRYQQGAFMKSGMVYFAGADTHEVPTRGVEKEFDVREFSSELVRKTGLEARLRAKGQVS